MGEFRTFSQAVGARFDSMSKGELFVVDVEDIFASYLAAFPDGTNPIFRERTEHDCNCCKNFIRNLGRVVALQPNGTRMTVWDHADLPAPYDVVSRALHQLVMQAPIKSVYRTKENRYGSGPNFDNHDSSIKWNHFLGVVDKRHKTTSPEKDRGELDAAFQVLNRGLTELTESAIATVLDLIEAKALYRGEEHLNAILGFKKLQAEYAKASDRSAFVWQNLKAPAARFRNTVIGTLIVDLSEGVELEKAVKMFESKVAPQNYKRPTALITPKMIEQAVATLGELGLEDAVQRRFATIEDVNVNDVLFVDNSVKGKMKGGLTDLLMDTVKPKTVDIKHATPIKIDQFLAEVLPSATSIDALIKNSQQGNFVSLTAPQNDDTGRLFKWNNDFAWSYDGGVADSLRQKVAAAGGRVDGVLRFSHQWNHNGRNASLMDLHVFMPGSSPFVGKCHDRYPAGQRVGWNRRSDPTSGGQQDVDYTNAAPEGYVPVENITFPSMSRLKDGKYVFAIHNWQLRQPTKAGFSAEIELNGVVYSYDYEKPLGQKEWVIVAEATLKNGTFTIEHKLPTSTSSREKWGINTETLVPVETVMLSPNYWEGAGNVGNRHLFLMLRGCKNPEAVRGIYNEFLRGDLDQHRKVFEVLGSKTMCQPSDSQLSGVGFSSTRSDEVVLVINGNRAYNVEF